jgi:hypothetical protein
MLDRLRGGALTAALVIASHPPRDLHWQSLRSVRYRVVVPTRLCAQMQRGGWKTLAALPWMDGPLDSPSHLMLRQLFEQQGLAPNVALRTEDTAALDTPEAYEWECNEDPTRDPDLAWLDSLCDSCDGSGYIDANASLARMHAIKRETCPDCGGTGQQAEDARKAADLQARLTMNDSDNATAMQLAAAEITSGERVAFSTGTGINPNPNE